MESEEQSELRWHYGPTETDKEPCNMWCYDCKGLVMFIDDGYICMKCNRTSEE